LLARLRVKLVVRRALAPLAPAEWARDSIELFEWQALAMLPPPNNSMELASGFARRHNGAADASAVLRPSAGYRVFAPLRAITSG
jgi:hypothetical protein